MKAQKEWATSPMPALTVPDALGAELAAAVRQRLERAGYTRYALLDRASYDLVEEPDEPELLAVLTALAQDITGRSLSLVSARVLRLVPGDYVLVRHDRVHDDRPIELTLDLSPAQVPDATVDYRHRGQVFFRVPSSPGALTLVERGPTVLSNHTYVSKRHASSVVVRLVVLLRSDQG